MADTTTTSSKQGAEDEETHAFLSKDYANTFERKTWKAADEDEDNDTSAFDEGQEDGQGDSQDGTESKFAVPKKVKRRLASLCMLACLCGFVAIIVTGSWLAAADVNASASSTQIAGYALLTVAGILLLLVLVLCCVSCLSSCARGGGGGGGGSGLFGGSSSVFRDEYDADDVHQRRLRPRFIFKVWGDEMRMDLYQHEQLLKGTMKPLPKPVLTGLAKALKAKRDKTKKQHEALELALEQRVTKLLEDPEQDPLQVVRDLRKRVYVVDFISGTTSVEDFASQITLVCKVANSKQDLIVFRISSPGGYVSEYGLAASHLVRVRELGFRTIACVDSVAASGGFMLCCVCDEIYAAPFAFVGSIGVITYVPNLDRLAKDTLKIDVHQFTAGKHKRTVDMFGPVTEEGKQKLQEELTLMHQEFKNHVQKQRGSKLKRPIDEVATGEAWLAVNALELGLVDRLVTSDQVLLGYSKEYDVLVLCEFQQPKSQGLREMLGVGANTALGLGNSVSKLASTLLVGGEPTQQRHKFEMV
ncbi:hypothetical protein BASA81_008705 [Batrachochytrium salamandrivorans]|nr:hypothetical protein BASA81_008705 [Batrachochytrium salamandrivorans]